MAHDNTNDAKFSGLNDITTTPNGDATDPNNNHQANSLSVNRLTNTNETSVINDTTGSIRQQSLFGNNNAPIGASSHIFEQQIQASIPQNNTTNDVSSQPSYVNSENMTESSSLSLSPPQQPTTSNISDHSVPMLLESEEYTVILSPNQHNNVCSSTGSPSNSSISISSIECCSHDHSDAELQGYCMPHVDNDNSNVNNIDNNMNQLDPNYAFNSSHDSTNQDDSSDYINNDSHVMVYVQSSSNSNNNHQNNTNPSSNDINVNYSNYSSISTISSMHSNNIQNAISMTPNNEYEGSGSSSSGSRSSDNITKSICPLCNLMLNRKQDLRRHLKVHNTSRSFECNYCYRKFSRKDTLHRHLNSPIGCRKHKKNQ